MVRRISITLVLLLCLAVYLGGAVACYSPTLPLPPPVRDEITWSCPDQSGSLTLRGGPGVMDPGEQAVIINLETMYGWIVPVDETGFEVTIIADMGDVLIIQRRLGDEIGPSIQVILDEEDCIEE
jgi:hypothetical protein